MKRKVSVLCKVVYIFYDNDYPISKIGIMRNERSRILLNLTHYRDSDDYDKQLEDFLNQYLIRKEY